MQGGGHAHGAQIGRAVRAGANLIEFGQAGNFSKVRDSPRMDNGGADVIDQLFLDKLLAIENGIEDFPHGKRRGGVLTDEAEVFLHLRWNRIFQPKQMKRFEAFPQAGSLNRSKAMVCVMQQEKVRSEFLAEPLEQAWHKVEIKVGVPDIFRRSIF